MRPYVKPYTFVGDDGFACDKDGVGVSYLVYLPDYPTYPHKAHVAPYGVVLGRENQRSHAIRRTLRIRCELLQRMLQHAAGYVQMHRELGLYLMRDGTHTEAIEEAAVYTWGDPHVSTYHINISFSAALTAELHFL